MFNKILIANRGEIAVRVMRACREMGIRSVAVYSEVDRAALHVRTADEAYLLGPAAASESYLNVAKILEVAKRCGADAIHPGYGFLSENHRFAKACADAGIKFIGPPASAMELMGSKLRARESMQKVNVPFVPGSKGAVKSAKEAAEVAGKIGYPVLLKASAGGGGKGMRLVHSADELQSALEGAQSEAQRAFGDNEVYIEKYLEKPRHIEIQVFGDEHGNIVHLGERECSLQRRHQKVVEECPSSFLDEATRQRMGATAVLAAKTAGYANAGTVEFLVDAQKNFYFLEMNTRLQVEHPVTELATGLDLVQMQIRIAAGEKLPFTQTDVQLRGHAVEVRLYAEDPDNNFFPSPGLIERLVPPGGPGIREDSGVYEGWRVPLDYDPLLSKLIAYAPDRRTAIARLRRALEDYYVSGIKTNIGLFRRILEHPAFIAGEIDTGFLDRMLAEKQAETAPDELKQVAALAAALFAGQSAAGTAGNGSAGPTSRWKKAARGEAVRS